MKVLVTGATGFVGSELCRALLFQGHSVRALVRSLETLSICGLPDVVEAHLVCDMDNASYLDVLFGVDCIIYCAARAHVAKECESDSLEAYRKVNTQGAMNLARQAAESGVRRFVYLSSIGVNGNVSLQPFLETDTPNPHNEYALSKYEAEKGLLGMVGSVNMDVVIIRPPLVYGPKPPGNFSSLISVVKRGYPLPLGSLSKNKRSLIALDNLIDFMLLCADYEKTPHAANQVFLISDGKDVSTEELFRSVAIAYGKRGVFPFPGVLLRLGAKLFGREAVFNKLCESLQVDSSKARVLLGWKPVITMSEQLKKIALSDAYEN